MAESVDNLILEQLRLIRADIARLDEKIDEKTDSLKADVSAFQSEVHDAFLSQGTMIQGLSYVVGHVGERVEHIEKTLGIKK